MKSLICLALGLSLIASCSSDYKKKKNYGTAPSGQIIPPVEGDQSGGNSNPEKPDSTGNNTPGASEEAPFAKTPPPASDRISDDFIPFFDDADIVLRDINRVQRDDPNSVTFKRYLTLSHLNFIETATEADFFKMKSEVIDSMAVLLNSLSTGQTIAKPTPIDEAWTVFRIDIRDYNWSAQQWDNLVAGRGGNDKDTYPYQNTFNTTELDIARRLRTRAAIVRADWLLTEATKPVSYYELTDVDTTINRFDDEQNTDRIDNIERAVEDPGSTSRVMRVGIGAGGSKKSIFNRMLERHKSKDGFVWMSYDFARQDGDNRRNIFVSPFGPNPDIGDINGRNNQRITAFRADNHSVMYSLPNGLMGFGLFDRNGNLIEAANPNVIFDANNRDDQGRIDAGVSCLGCHGAGLKPAKDELRDNMSRSIASDLFTDDVVKTVLNLHPEQAKIDAQMKKDNESILSTIAESRLLAKDGNGGINGILKYYDRDLSADMVASELNLTVDQLNRALPFLSEDLQLKLQPMASNQLDRDTFEDLFPQLIDELFDLEQRKL